MHTGFTGRMDTVLNWTEMNWTELSICRRLDDHDSYPLSVTGVTVMHNNSNDEHNYQLTPVLNYGEPKSQVCPLTEHVQDPADLSCLTLDPCEGVACPARHVPAVVSPADRGKQQGGRGSARGLCLTAAMTGPGERGGGVPTWRLCVTGHLHPVPRQVRVGQAVRSADDGCGGRVCTMRNRIRFID